MPQHDGRGSADREILDIIPERFDADPDSRHARRGAHARLILTIALALLAVAALGVAARHILMGDTAPQQQAGSVPGIKADDRPIKTRPTNPGGLDVPNKDKLVYERIGQGEAEPQRERLLPPPEQPQAPAPRAATIKPAFPAPPPKATPGKPGAEASPADIAQAAAPAAPANTASQPQAPAQSAAKPPAVAAAPSPAPAKAAVAAAQGGWVVQLAALKTEAEAKSEWSRIAGASKDVLGGFSSDIVQADLGAKGIFWRLRAGPMDEAKARSVCAELAKRGQGCLVAKK